MSHYIHDIPGRLRVKIPSIKANPVRAAEIEGLLDGLAGVNSVAVNITTGSIVVQYDHRVVNSGRILDIFRSHGHLDPSKIVNSAEYIEDAVTKTGRFVGKALLGLLVEKAFEGTPLALVSMLL